MDGYISLHRKFLSWEWHDNPNVVAVWVHLLLTANYTRKEWHGISIGRGQVLTSMASLAKTVGITSKQARRCIEKLKSTGEINTSVINIKGANQRANLATLITISKYDTYQSDDNTDGQTIGQSEGKARASTNKDNNIYIEDKSSMSTELTNEDESDDIKLPKRTSQIDYKAMANYWNETMKNSNIPFIKGITQSRQGVVNARVSEYGKEAVARVFVKVSKSKYLNGDNGYNFIASFDWAMRKTIFPKILEGNYDSK